MAAVELYAETNLAPKVKEGEKYELPVTTRISDEHVVRMEYHRLRLQGRIDSVPLLHFKGEGVKKGTRGE